MAAQPAADRRHGSADRRFSRAARQRTWRRRQRDGHISLPIEISFSEFAEAALLAGIIAERDIDNREVLAEAAGAVIGAWTAAWLKER